MLKCLALENFRCYKKYQVDLDDTTIFVGPNGIGKTNIVEAVWLLATGRSWRTPHDLEVILWEKDFCRISSKIENDVAKELELFLQKETVNGKQMKIFKLNKVKKRVIELLGEMPAVLFSPETIQMIGGAPQLRRRFLDIMLSEVDKKYALTLLDLSKILRERNKLLFYIKTGKSKEDELEFWDQKLIVLSKFLIKKRQEAIKYFNLKIDKVYQEISGKKEELKLRYMASVEAERFEEHLIAVREREIEQTATLYGPHRDDLEIILDKRELSSFGSRGEYRSTVLALKVLELEYLSDKKGERPILLLDDIFSELDKDRRMHLAKIVSGQQTIITTTDLDHVEKSLREKARIVELK